MISNFRSFHFARALGLMLGAALFSSASFAGDCFSPGALRMSHRTDDGKFIYVALDPMKLPPSDSSLVWREWEPLMNAVLKDNAFRFFNENRDRVQGEITISPNNSLLLLTGLRCYPTMEQAQRSYERDFGSSWDSVGVALHGNWIDPGAKDIVAKGSEPPPPKAASAAESPPPQRSHNLEATRPVFQPQKKPLYTFLAQGNFGAPSKFASEADALRELEKGWEAGPRRQYPDAFNVKIVSRDPPICRDLSLTDRSLKGKNTWHCYLRAVFWVSTTKTPPSGVRYTTTEAEGTDKDPVLASRGSGNIAPLQLTANSRPDDSKRTDSGSSHANGAANQRSAPANDAATPGAGGNSTETLHRYTRDIGYAGAMLAPTKEAAIESAQRQRAKEEPSYREFASAKEFRVTGEGAPECINNPVNRRPAFKGDNWICTIKVSYYIESRQQPPLGASPAGGSRSVTK
ncbi:hypothetical protein G7048_28045 (plasmid) [Diaphorobacter sp. HDW4B]|uniref:hypothetical protein n=1 Tax=Diaphorobacter sp. HDW4B TaxID=2714925 RepID=UPI00140A51F9|nr:hypothetical protein [Diaphorobacter sp. HDW4B]QIL74316.1 hypothetical protein G7048_28045 [Diaphorobacter sp. HDW4B]